MPYIKQKNRGAALYDPRNPGELNYALTELCRLYWQNKGNSYQTINDVLGALEGAKQEFYRRVVVPYESTKIRENGDVYS